jgi:crotonobetainyl-CoA:carnitine CoA-transferase CaiB-like acyl-CoA transferase
MITDPHGPLHGLRVLDASRVLAGPYCGQLLGDLGAEVIKVEHPKLTDETRGWGPPFLRALSAYYLSCNRNKKAITLDLAQPDGREVFRALAARCDVLLENFRASSASKLGVTPEAMLAINPRLIVCSISGFGRTGPWRDLPGYDFAIQAQSGLMSITGPVEGPPTKVGVAVADVLTGLHAAVGVLACLQARERSGHGYTIDLALLDCALAAQVNVAQAYLTSGEEAPRQGNAHLQIVPYQLFATRDSWLVLAVGNDGQWQRFCAAAEKPDLAGDPRFTSNTLRVEKRAILVPILEVLLHSLSTSQWQERLQAAGVPHAPVWGYTELFQHSQAQARGLRVQVRDPQGNPVDLIGTPFHLGGATQTPPTAPPQVGQDTASVLSTLLGYSAERIKQLRQNGAI